MSKSLFTLEKSKIDFKEINSFCEQQISEGLKVEYKRDFPKNVDLAKSICAFANSEGGILLIGIEADKKSNVPINLPGIDTQNGVEERISSICIGHILPRIIPEIKLCAFKATDGKERLIVFIRVDRSHFPPHYLWQTREILVRVNCENVRADLQTIEDLFKKRKKNQDDNYFTNSAIWNYKYLEIAVQVIESMVFSLNIAREAIPFNRENDIIFSRIANVVLSFDEEIPSPNQLMLLKRNSEGRVIGACRIDGEKLVFQKAANVERNKLHAIECFQFLLQVLKAGQEFCNHIAFYGDITFGLNIETEENLSLGFPIEVRLNDEYKSEFKLVSVSRTIRFDEFSNLSQIIQSMFGEFCRFFHLSLDHEKIKEIVETYFMPLFNRQVS